VQVRELEDCPHFNAGRGSVLTADGTVEMEACVMEGATLRCGAVAGLSTVANAVSLARLVMDKTPHIYLAFDGAEAFAREQVRRVTSCVFVHQSCSILLLYHYISGSKPHTPSTWCLTSDSHHQVHFHLCTAFRIHGLCFQNSLTILLTCACQSKF
jgi:hypothetical protein